MYSEKQCPQLPKPTEHMIFNLMSVDNKSTIAVSCSEGYELVGSPIKVCGEDGQWTAQGIEPYCKGQCVTLQQGYHKSTLIGRKWLSATASEHKTLQKTQCAVKVQEQMVHFLGQLYTHTYIYIYMCVYVVCVCMFACVCVFCLYFRKLLCSFYFSKHIPFCPMTLICVNWLFFIRGLSTNQSIGFTVNHTDSIRLQIDLNSICHWSISQQ